MTDGNTLTLKRLAEACSRGPDDLSTALARLRHWDSTGVLPTVATGMGLDLGDRHPGRGKVRSYPIELLPWCRLFAALADRGLPVMRIATAANSLVSAIRSSADQARLFASAINGNGKDVFFIAHEVRWGPRMRAPASGITIGPDLSIVGGQPDRDPTRNRNPVLESVMKAKLTRGAPICPSNTDFAVVLNLSHALRGFAAP